MQTVDQFENWLKFAKPGSRFVYHVGNLAADRVRVGREVVKDEEGNDRVYIRAMPVPLFDNMGKMALQAYYQKRVMLFQRRIKPGVCEYFAVKVRGQGGSEKRK